MKVNDLFEADRLQYFEYKEDELVETLKKECSEIISTYKSTGKYLYRGEKDARIRRIFKASIHQDRIPVQMDLKIHHRFNDALKSAGFIAHRGNSIFTTGDRSVAEPWGKLIVIVLPVNGFDYTWFDYDSTEYVYNDIVEFAKRMQYQIAYDRMKEYGLETIENKLKSGLLAGAKQERDTLKMYSLYGFNSDGSIKPYGEIRDSIWKHYVTVTLGATKTRLKEAVAGGKEVLFANCQYYGVPDSSFLLKLMK